MKGDDPEIDTAQTSKRLDGHLALLKKIQKTFTESIPDIVKAIDMVKSRPRLSQKYNL